MDRLTYSDIEESYNGKTVLITGHTGFKGSWLSIWLKELGANVIGYSLPPPTTPSIFNTIHLENYITHNEGDINEYSSLLRTFSHHRPDIVFHLAAQPIVRRSYIEPRNTFETNVMGTLNVLEAIRAVGCVKTAIMVTSDKCYKNKEWEFAYRENDELGGMDPYSSSKSCAEILTAAYRESFFNQKDYGELHATVLSTVRAGNVIGGGDWGEDRLVPDCVRNFQVNDPVEIRSPLAVRPWQYVLDPLYGYLLLGAYMNTHGISFGSEWNFGPEIRNCINVESLVQKLIDAWVGGEYSLRAAKDKKESLLLRLDANKAKVLLGWRPEFDVLESIERTVKWYKLFNENQGNSTSDIEKTMYSSMKEEIQDCMERKV